MKQTSLLYNWLIVSIFSGVKFAFERRGLELSLSLRVNSSGRDLRVTDNGDRQMNKTTVQGSPSIDRCESVDQRNKESIHFLS